MEAPRSRSLRPWWCRKLAWLVAGAVLLALVLGHRSVLRGLGAVLIVEDAPTRVDAAYVLGGGPVERGARGAQLLRERWCDTLVTTGVNIHRVLEAEGVLFTEAELTARAAYRAGADSARVRLLEEGTSTWEEAAAVLRDAKAHGYDSIAVVSTEFHLRRVRRVFRKHFEGSGIALFTVAAYNPMYDHTTWWQSEDGLLMVNNEYVKSLYYLITY
ncbi:MAG: YdcF family protein [Flavobacteriales bacterium]